MRPRVRSYGDNSTLTLSPGRMRIKFKRILPDTWASTLWPVCSSTRNIALGSASVTVPSTSIVSFLAIPSRQLVALGPHWLKRPEQEGDGGMSASARVRSAGRGAYHAEVPQRLL